MGVMANSQSKVLEGPGRAMQQDEFPVGAALERYRNYLRLLARVQLGSRPGVRLDPSDLVQQTLLEAYQKREQYRGTNDAERAGWLRMILARNVADALRAQGRLKRDVSRERSLEQELAESSARLGAWLVADGASPCESAQRHEQAIRLADALASLSADQREALVLHYWQGCTLAEVSVQLERTPGAVAGLLKRGLKHLREQLGTY
jgi:RNA polymerase sigma-70 factor (ECF subfamily)